MTSIAERLGLDRDTLNDLLDTAVGSVRSVGASYALMGEIGDRKAAAVVDTAVRAGLLVREGSRRQMLARPKETEWPRFDDSWLLEPVGAELVQDPEWRANHWLLESGRPVEETRVNDRAGTKASGWAASLPKPPRGSARHFMVVLPRRGPGAGVTWAVDRATSLEDDVYKFSLDVVGAFIAEGMRTFMGTASMRLGETVVVDFMRAREHARGRDVRYLTDVRGSGGEVTERLAAHVERYFRYVNLTTMNAKGYLERARGSGVSAAARPTSLAEATPRR